MVTLVITPDALLPSLHVYGQTSDDAEIPFARIPLGQPKEMLAARARAASDIAQAMIRREGETLTDEQAEELRLDILAAAGIDHETPEHAELAAHLKANYLSRASDLA